MRDTHNWLEGGHPALSPLHKVNIQRDEELCSRIPLGMFVVGDDCRCGQVDAHHEVGWFAVNG